MQSITLHHQIIVAKLPIKLLPKNTQSWMNIINIQEKFKNRNTTNSVCYNLDDKYILFENNRTTLGLSM